MSKGALWATRTLPRANSRKAGSTADTGGAWATIGSVMPVRTEMKGGIGQPGFTRVCSSPSSWPPRTLTAPISVISLVAGLPPVVSRSTTTKVTSCSGVPRWPRLGRPTRRGRWPVHGPAAVLPVRAGRGAGSGSGPWGLRELLMRGTVGAGSDTPERATGRPSRRGCRWLRIASFLPRPTRATAVSRGGPHARRLHHLSGARAAL